MTERWIEGISEGPNRRPVAGPPDKAGGLTNSNLTTLGDFVQVLRRRWWIVALVVVIALVSAYAYSKHQSPAYRANADVRLNAQTITQVLNNPQQS